LASMLCLIDDESSNDGRCPQPALSVYTYCLGQN